VTYAIAAAGTGGHVFPGLAVGEALVERGVSRRDILYVGGNRLEATVYPREGFEFLSVELRGLKRSFSLANLGIPAVVMRAISTMAAEFRRRDVGAVLGLGGYVTIPAARAAKRTGAALAVAEQNAEAGLANAVASRWADVSFGAFAETMRIRNARWVGNPIRAQIAAFDRDSLRSAAFARYDLDEAIPVLGVFGGSLGAAAINDAVTTVAREWPSQPIQILHLAGSQHADELTRRSIDSVVPWKIVGFEDRMDLFYAACDLVVARAGGAVAELSATGTPSILVPGAFGSGNHQVHNAAAFRRAGASEVLEQDRLEELGALVASLIFSPERLALMVAACRSLAKPDAATVIAATLEDLHG